MKILILTQRLETNYGCLLQAYALQHALKNMGHEVWTEDRRLSDFFHLKIRIRCFLRNIIYFKNKKYFATNKVNKILQKNTRQFVLKNVQITEPVRSTTKKLIIKYKFDAYIVGSDQVWTRHSPSIYNYFLDFTEGLDVKRIAYSASFGVDSWEFSKKETKRCKQLIKSFDAVSVREKAGVDLCRDYLNVSAVQTLDPTMLLSKEDYLYLLKDPDIQQNENIFVHFLPKTKSSKTKEKYNILNELKKQLKRESFQIQPTEKYYDVGKKNINDCVFPPVEYFLKGIYSARYVITDSFHAVVFSLIFNKPFIVIANHYAGLTSRIISLLEMFNLQDRLILTSQSLDLNRISPINFEKVNEIIKKQRERSIEFLKKSLSG